jgi:hypothetical protein
MIVRDTLSTTARPSKTRRRFLISSLGVDIGTGISGISDQFSQEASYQPYRAPASVASAPAARPGHGLPASVYLAPQSGALACILSRITLR